MNVENYNKYIESLQLENAELRLKVNLLENICERLRDYFSDNNLNHKNIKFLTLNDEYISSLEEYKDIIVVKIPEVKFVISSKGA